MSALSRLILTVILLVNSYAFAQGVVPCDDGSPYGCEDLPYEFVAPGVAVIKDPWRPLCIASVGVASVNRDTVYEQPFKSYLWETIHNSESIVIATVDSFIERDTAIRFGNIIRPITGLPLIRVRIETVLKCSETTSKKLIRLNEFPPLKLAYWVQPREIMCYGFEHVVSKSFLFFNFPLDSLLNVFESNWGLLKNNQSYFTQHDSLLILPHIFTFAENMDTVVNHLWLWDDNDTCEVNKFCPIVSASSSGLFHVKDFVGTTGYKPGWWLPPPKEELNLIAKNALIVGPNQLSINQIFDDSATFFTPTQPLSVRRGSNKNVPYVSGSGKTTNAYSSKPHNLLGRVAKSDCASSVKRRVNNRYYFKK